MARVREAQGDLGAALNLLDEAQRVYTGDYSPNVRPVPAMRARVRAAHGRGRRSPRLGARAGLSADDNLTYVREFEHITLARALLAQYASDGDRAPWTRARAPASSAVGAAEAGGRTGSVIEILVLQALVHPSAATRRRAGAAGTGAHPGRTGRLRPGLRRRGPSDGGLLKAVAAEARLGVCPSAPDRRSTRRLSDPANSARPAWAWSSR